MKCWWCCECCPEIYFSVVVLLSFVTYTKTRKKEVENREGSWKGTHSLLSNIQWVLYFSMLHPLFLRSQQELSVRTVERNIKSLVKFFDVCPGTKWNHIPIEKSCADGAIFMSQSEIRRTTHSLLVETTTETYRKITLVSPGHGGGGGSYCKETYQ